MFLSRRLATTLLAASTIAACGPAPSESTPPSVTLQVPAMAINADQRLADADAAIEKAMLLIQASQNPGAPNPDRPFGGHDTKALRNLQAAREEIAAAQAYASVP